MIKSMTGYGKKEFDCGNKKITIEIKSLNSKQLDLSTRISSLYREKDLEIRKTIAEKVIRGKLEFSMYVESLGSETKTAINKDVVKSYYEQMSEIMGELKLEVDHNIMANIMRLPDTMKTESSSLDENEWKQIKLEILNTIDALDIFRKEEGESLNKDLQDNIQTIGKLLTEIEPFEKQRIENVKQRLNDGLKEFEKNGKADKNRFEQELIFYIEKLDINEEKVRLKQHLEYFIETMDKNSSSVGKKLGFIAQEIGREVNTLGSKANESNMQRIVVQMKDSLERIKEQVLNVL